MAELETRDTGKVMRETRAVIAYVAEYYRYFAGMADKIEIGPADRQARSRGLHQARAAGRGGRDRSWNNQLFLSAAKVGPALAAGNTVVHQGLRGRPGAAAPFRQADRGGWLPEGVVNVITGFGNDCGATLTSHPLVAASPSPAGLRPPATWCATPPRISP